MTLSPEACRRAAELLLAARRNLAPIPALPEDCRPATVAEGYAIQAARTLLATEQPFHGCLFADGVHDSPATLTAGDTLSA